MLFPETLRRAAEEYAGKFDIKTLVNAAGAISERYREEKSDGSQLVNKEAETAAYAVSRMPATFAAVSSALEHALSHFTGAIRTAADIGAGTGAAGWAAAELITGIEKIDCYERVRSMRIIGEKLMNEAEFPIQAEWHDNDITKTSLCENYDLVTVSYVLNELTEKDRERVITELWEKTDGMLLITEPGTIKGYYNILQARRILKNNGALIACPCPDTAECPLPEGDWCHFTARAARSKLHKQLKGGEAPYEDEKFSFIAAVRNGSIPCRRRILRHPQISGGVIGLHVCSESGIEDIKVTKSSELFKKARKSESGDEI